MIRWSERVGLRRPTGAWATAGVLLACGTFGPRAARAQRPATRDTARADTAQRSARDSAARFDSLHRALPDSVARDSVVASQLADVARRPERSIFHQLNLDRLRLREIGLDGGVAFPDQVRSTALYALHADYGEIVPDFRVVFGATYWTSRYTDDAVDGFAQALGRAISAQAPHGPPGDSVHVGQVRSSDVALSVETRWRPRVFGRGGPAGVLRPWLAVGAATHFINVQNPTLDGTFVARALDGVALGPTGAVGFDFTPVRAFRVSAEARYDLFNGARYGSVRAGASYVFERRRGL